MVLFAVSYGCYRISTTASAIFVLAETENGKALESQIVAKDPIANGTAKILTSR
jgi:hypothetical protein